MDQKKGIYAPLTVSVSGNELTVSCTPGGDIGGNGARYNFTVRSDCQPLAVDGKDVDRVQFTVVGEWEVAQLLAAFERIAAFYRAGELK